LAPYLRMGLVVPIFIVLALVYITLLFDILKDYVSRLLVLTKARLVAKRRFKGWFKPLWNLGTFFKNDIQND